MKTLLIATSMIVLSGCSTFNPELLDNRVSCTLGRDTALYSSMYGPIGITSKVSQKDSPIICPPVPVPK